VAASTSFRISDTARTRLASRAAREGMTATALLDQLITEGTDQLDYPGIIFRGPAHDRRAALAAGPDVWEVVARLQELDGSEEHRISLLAAESDLHPRLIRIALDYAAEHAGQVRGLIDRNRDMTERSQAMARQRESLLA
jgi:PAS domain-containing protein